MCFYKKEKEILPEDVRKRINIDFPIQSQRKLVKERLEILFGENWNVGSEQLVRSILYLIKGNISLLENFNQISDPRDIIVEAQKDSKGSYNYFIDEFK